MVDAGKPALRVHQDRPALRVRLQRVTLVPALYLHKAIDLTPSGALQFQEKEARTSYFPLREFFL